MVMKTLLQAMAAQLNRCNNFMFGTYLIVMLVWLVTLVERTETEYTEMTRLIYLKRWS